MNLEEYFKEEGIEIVTGDQYDIELDKLLTKEQQAYYDELDETYCMHNTPDNIQKFYDYTIQKNLLHLMIGFHLPQYLQEMPIVLETIAPHHTILDIGSNSGLKTIFYALKYPEKEFIGIDISQESLKLANRQKQKYQVPNVEFKFMDMTKMQFPKEYFDCIIADHSLHETQPQGYFYDDCDPCNFEEKLRNIHPIMKPGKMITLLTPSSYVHLESMFPLFEELAGFIPLSTIPIKFQVKGRTITDLVSVCEKK